MRSFTNGLMILAALALPAVAFAAESEKVEQPAAKVYKVNELYEVKTNLDKTKVTVTGKVVKVSSGIMRRNWVHIQDATIKPKTPDKDLTITTTEAPPNVGQIVTATGIAAVHKDFGSGYFFDLILEQAEFK